MSGLKQTTFFFPFKHNLLSLSNPVEYLEHAVNLYFMLK